MNRIVCMSVAGFLTFLVALTCNDPTTSPFSSDKATVTLLLQSSTFKESDSAITDTVGKTIRLCVCLFLTQHIDSTVITVGKSITSLDTAITCLKKDCQIDTASYDLTFSTAGVRTVIATAYVGNIQKTARAIIHVLDRPAPNRPPVLAVSGSNSVVVGQTCTLTVAANDPDSGQSITIDTLASPAGALFVSDTFTWTTTIADTGIDTIVFIARDNGDPVLTDTETVAITVTATDTNHAPEWDSGTVTLAGQPGSPISLTLADKCTDPDNDSIAFQLLPGSPDNDTIQNSVYSFTPAAAHEGTFFPKVAAFDPDSASDTLTIQLTISASDTTPPELTLLSPSKDTVIAIDSCRIQVQCTDASGIASVTMAVDTGAGIAATRPSDTIFAATVKGLAAGQYSTVTIIATDSAPGANCDSAIVRIKYDNDHTPPNLNLLTPSNDSTSTNSNSATVRVIATDASGIALITCTIGPDSFTVSKSSDSVYSSTVTGLVQDQFNRIVFMATDSSLAANRCTLSVHIKFDPTMLDSIGPTIIQTSGPTSGSVISDSIIAITDSIIDPSGIDSVYWTLNGTRAGIMTLISGANAVYSLLDTLTTYRSNRIVVHAIDGSTRRNRDSAVVILDYNMPPIISDTSFNASFNTALSFSLVASSPDGDTITWSKAVSSLPAHGTTSIISSPSITYTPENGWIGADSFYVRISDGYYSDTAKILITTIDTRVAPVINSQPKDTSVNKPMSAHFSVSINSDATSPLVYTWWKEGLVPSKATTPALSFPATAYSDSGRYRVIVSNDKGSDTSIWATLIVYDTIKPILTLVGSSNVIIPAGIAWTDPGATASDDYPVAGSNISTRISISASPTTFDASNPVVGTYILSYNVTDLSGNVATTINRTVKVVGWERIVPPGNDVEGQCPRAVITSTRDIFIAYSVTGYNPLYVAKLSAGTNSWLTTQLEQFFDASTGNYVLELSSDKAKPFIGYACYGSANAFGVKGYSANGWNSVNLACETHGPKDALGSFALSPTNDPYVAIYDDANSGTPFWGLCEAGNPVVYPNVNDFHSSISCGSADQLVFAHDSVVSWYAGNSTWNNRTVPCASGLADQSPPRIIIKYGNDNKIYALRLTNNGNPQLFRETFNDWQPLGGGPIKNGPVLFPKLIQGNDGEMFAAYYDSSTTSIVIKKYDAVNDQFIPFPGNGILSVPQFFDDQLNYGFALMVNNGSVYVVYAYTTGGSRHMATYRYAIQ